MKPQNTTHDTTKMPPRRWPPEPIVTDDNTALESPATRGKTYVVDTVIGTIARTVAEQIEGIHHVGAAGLRGVMQKLGSGGVNAEVGMKEAAVSLDIVILFGYSIRDLAAELRQRVIEAVSAMANRKLVAVDINVVGVSLDKSDSTPGRELA